MYLILPPGFLTTHRPVRFNSRAVSVLFEYYKSHQSSKYFTLLKICTKIKIKLLMHNKCSKYNSRDPSSLWSDSEVGTNTSNRQVSYFPFPIWKEYFQFFLLFTAIFFRHDFKLPEFEIGGETIRESVSRYSNICVGLAQQINEKFLYPVVFCNWLVSYANYEVVTPAYSHIRVGLAE
jgi:hypothetical protein